jgi:hypothetical protein
VDDRQIEVNAIEVRRALARSFTGHNHGDHAWLGSVGIGDVEVAVDVLTAADGRPYVHVAAPVTAAAELDGRLARLLVIENGELVFGRFTHAAGQVRVEHAILAGSTMAAVEVQASVWTVGWAAGAFAPRLEALLREGTPPPPAPRPPAALDPSFARRRSTLVSPRHAELSLASGQRRPVPKRAAPASQDCVR